MGQNSNIEWCDHTFNPVIGCTKWSPGCLNCYAETLDERRFSKTMDGGTKAAPVSHWGPGAPRHRTSEANWMEVRRWNMVQGGLSCGACGAQYAPMRWKAWEEATRNGARPSCHTCGGELVPRRARVFCASLADWLDQEWPVEVRVDLLRLEGWSARLHEALAYASHEGDVATAEWIAAWLNGDAPGNVSIGVSVEDQKRADERIPELLKIPAKVRFLSCEPLLGPVNLNDITVPIPGGEWHFGAIDPEENPEDDEDFHGAKVDWVIVGGESGDEARPMHPQWARSLRDQCQSAGLPFFFKQWGEWSPRALLTINGQPYGGGTDFAKLDPGGDRWPRIIRLGEHGRDTRRCENCTEDAGEETFVQRVGKALADRVLDGRTWDEFPAVLDAAARRPYPVTARRDHATDAQRRHPDHGGR